MTAYVLPGAATWVNRLASDRSGMDCAQRVVHGESSGILSRWRLPPPAYSGATPRSMG